MLFLMHVIIILIIIIIIVIIITITRDKFVANKKWGFGRWWNKRKKISSYGQNHASCKKNAKFGR